MRLFKEILFTLAIAVFAALFVIWTTGCATFEPAPYWQKTRPPVTPTATIWTDENPVCNGVESWGCADSNTGIVIISKKAPPLLWACILEHEKRMHLELGYTHRTDGIALGGVWCNQTTFMRVPT